MDRAARPPLTASADLFARSAAYAAAQFAQPDPGPGSPGELALELDPLTVQRPHLELIDQVFIDMDAGRCDRAIVTTPPQVGKSTRVVWGMFWWLRRHQHHRGIVASYGADLAKDRGRAVRNLVRDHGARYGMVLAPDKTASYDWALVSGGGMRTGGLDSGLTGQPGDIGIIDDPVKDRAAADSVTVQKATREWYSGTFLSRLAPGAPQLVVCTRWSPEDLAGWLLEREGDEREGGKWRVVHVPAIADPRFGPDPLGRQPGEPCPHPKIAVFDVAAARAHWESKRAMSTVRDWHALYQGDPKPREGALLSADRLAAQRCYRPQTEQRIVAVAVDPSGGGRDTAGIIAGFLGADKRLYWTRDLSGVMGSDEWGRAAAGLARQIGADRVVIETNYGRDMALLVVRTSWVALSDEEVKLRRDELIETGGLTFEEATKEAEQSAWGLPPRIVPVTSRRNKLLRAEPIAQQIQEDRIRLAAPMPELESEWLDWRPESGWSPGRIDASVHLAYALLPVPGASTVVSFGGSAMAQTRIG